MYSLSSSEIDDGSTAPPLPPTEAPCGQDFAGVATGTLTSPNYPNEYNAYDSCTWTITVTEGKFIRLTFTEFQVSRVGDFGNFDSLSPALI